jgi:hypothetical protein
MTPYTTRARRIGEVLLASLMTVGAIAGSGCGARSSDPETAFWDQYIRVMDVARARGDFYAADAARQTAYLAALRSQRWDALAAVGDASIRLAEEFPRVRQTLRPEVHRIYGAALLRASEQGSFEGVLRVSEAFADLGDREGAREGLTVAADMLAASRGARDAERLKALAERLEYQASLTADSTEDVEAPVAAVTATWTR